MQLQLGMCLRLNSDVTSNSQQVEESLQIETVVGHSFYFNFFLFCFCICLFKSWPFSVALPWRIAENPPESLVHQVQPPFSIVVSVIQVKVSSSSDISEAFEALPRDFAFESTRILKNAADSPPRPFQSPYLVGIFIDPLGWWVNEWPVWLSSSISQLKLPPFDWWPNGIQIIDWKQTATFKCQSESPHDTVNFRALCLLSDLIVLKLHHSESPVHSIADKLTV